MNQKEYNNHVKNLLQECEELTTRKGKDYTRGDEDLLINFKEGSKFFDVHVYKYVGFPLKKQMDAIYSYIKTKGQSESEPIRERIKDSINYLIFLSCLIEENEWVN